MSTALEAPSQTLPYEEPPVVVPVLSGPSYALALRFMIDALKDHSSMSWPEAVGAVTTGASTYHETPAAARGETGYTTAATAAPATEVQDANSTSQPLPPRRFPLLAGETSGHLRNDDVTKLWRAEDGQNTRMWLMIHSRILRSHNVLHPDEDLVAVSHDMTYALTSEGRPIAL